jgi:formylglycine-generating enzyme required for sulfatase activity
MGSPESDIHRNSDETRHKVTITKGFYLQTTEVTQNQWKEIMESNPSRFDLGDDHPVEMVTYHDVQRFISRLNQKEKTDRYRLPTEAEWEFACRAGTTTLFYFGNSLFTSQANYNGHYPLPGDPRGVNRNRTVPVKSFPPNRLGLFEMHGNVYEWCSDWYDAYPTGHVTDPKGPSRGISKVCRGGGLSSYARRCRSANRTKHLPIYSSFYIGFRLAFTANDD